MLNKIATILSQLTGVPIESVTMETSPDNLETWDSSMHLNLVMALEEAFGIQFSETEIVEMMNVGLIQEVLKAHGVTP
ncbi:MAG: acyl carrier protein [Alphaproteobacteria bacterium]|jgi:acyl carrier protein|nr:acyl carrier protein [Alphaproteobacteria bacterium]